ncbi:uncharacterized protein TNCV_1788641 [Trichonephila clavipes]|nr:uncharacterized protein TNCV_1788641 [Trichonephila clavipes]
MAAVAAWSRYRIMAGFVTGLSPVPLKTRRVGQRCALNLSRAQTSSRWCGSYGSGCQLRCRPRHFTMVQNYVVRLPKPSGKILGGPTAVFGAKNFSPKSAKLKVFKKTSMTKNSWEAHASAGDEMGVSQR